MQAFPPQLEPLASELAGDIRWRLVRHRDRLGTDSEDPWVDVIQDVVSNHIDLCCNLDDQDVHRESNLAAVFIATYLICTTPDVPDDDHDPRFAGHVLTATRLYLKRRFPDGGGRWFTMVETFDPDDDVVTGGEDGG